MAFGCLFVVLAALSLQRIAGGRAYARIGA
jgi:hypothetical protein